MVIIDPILRWYMSISLCNVENILNGKIIFSFKKINYYGYGVFILICVSIRNKLVLYLTVRMDLN